MASSALEAKINKIRQQNEEIRRRYEEVEEDKKNAAKLNALVQMVPSTDWPERKEPPEFSNPPRTKPKVAKEKHEYIPQTHPGEGKKVHAFAQGEGPPPDPKYNFLADSEREETNAEYARENTGNRIHNKTTRGNIKKKTIGREGIQKDNKTHKGSHRDEYQPGYDAWRAERNRIDEDRISRQRTAEGNWRREWDNDKMHIVDNVIKTSTRPSLGDFAKKDHKDFDRRYHTNGYEHVNLNRGGNHRPHRGASKNFYSNYENRSHNTYDQHRPNLPMTAKPPLSPTSEERTVIVTDKNIKVTLNHGNATKGPVMSVKVNSLSIAGTGRVGPRQRTRVTYSHSDAEVTTPEIEPFSRQKSFDDKPKGSSNIKRSHSQKKKEGDSKSPYFQRKGIKGEEDDIHSQRHDNEFQSYPRKDVQKPHSASKSPRPMRGNTKPMKHDLHATYLPKKEDEQIVVGESDANSKGDNVHVHHVEENATICTDLDSKIENDIPGNESSSRISQSISSEIESSKAQSKKINIEDEVIVIAKEKNENKNSKENNIDEEGTTMCTYLDSKVEYNIAENESSKILKPTLYEMESSTMQNEKINIEDEVSLVAEEKHENTNSKENNADIHHIEEDAIICTDSKIENDVAENESSQISKVALGAKKKNENATELASKDEVMETTLISATSIENLEDIAKDTIKEDNTNNKNAHSEDSINTLMNDLQETRNLSSDESVLNKIQLQVELVANESNKVSDDNIKLDATSKDDQENESSKEVSELSVSNNCDNIKDEVIDEQPGEDMTAQTLVRSSEAEACSVIEVTNRAVCDNEAVKKETVETREKVDGNHEPNTSCNTGFKDITSPTEVKTEDTVNLSNVNVDGNLEDKVESENKTSVEKDDKKNTEKVGDSEE